MPQINNSYAKQPSQQKIAYDRTLLSRLLPKLVFVQFGQTDKRTIPKKEGDTISLNRFNRYPTATVPLIEGVTPPGRNMSVSTIRATVAQYGDYTIISDLIDMMGIDPVVVETLKVHGEQAGETLDEVARDIVCAGTNVLYATAGAIARNQVTAGSDITGALIRRCKQIHSRNNVARVGDSYIGFVHPDTVFDFQGCPGWVAADHYAGSKKIFSGEVGTLWGVRFIETTMAPVFAGEGFGGVDVYGTIVIGAGAYGVVDVAGSSKPQTIVKALGSAGTADALDQRSSVGWKALMTAVRLQELAILRLEHTVSI